MIIAHRKRKQFITLTLSVHNPSNWKRQAMRRMMAESQRCYSALLHRYRDDVMILASIDDQIKQTTDKAQVKELKANSLVVRKAMMSSAEKYARRQPMPNSCVSGVVADFEAQADSYLQLRDSQEDSNSYPEIHRPGYPEQDYYSDGLSELTNSADLESYNEARNLMARKQYAGIPMPLNFARYRRDGGFMLLQNESGELYAYLPVLRNNSRYCRKTTISNMIDIRTGEIVSFSTKIAIMLPLRFSDDIRSTLIDRKPYPAFTGNVDIKTARLIMRNDQLFQLAVSIEIETADRETNSVMGIDRGIDKLAAVSVISDNGAILEQTMIDGGELRNYQRKASRKAAERQRYGKVKHGVQWKRYADQVIFIAANQLVELADKHSAQIVLEDLKAITMGHHHKRKKGARRSNFSIMLNRAQYAKLQDVLTYKLAIRGLPKPLFVRAAYTSLTCPHCGHQDKANRPDQATFKCQKCSHTAHADLNASYNIARKLDYEQWIKPKLKKGNKIAKDQTFSAWIQQQNNVAEYRVSA